MKTKCAVPADKITSSEPCSARADTRRRAKSQLSVRTGVRAGAYATIHPAKVTVPDIKI